MVNLFGNGFVGKQFSAMFPTIINERNDYVPKTNNVFYTISTVDNYNIYTDPFIDIDTNLNVLIRVLENCKNKNITFNFASSWFVYGNTRGIAHEDTICNPIGFYSITKRTAEQLLIEYCKSFGIQYRILRFANVLGKNDTKVSKKKNILTYMINELKNDRQVELFNKGEFYRDYIHVADLCNAVKLIMDKGEINSIYNVGNSNPILFKDAIFYAAEKLGKTPNVKLVSEGNTSSLYLNCGKLFDLGFTPKYTIKNMIDELIV